jgi:3',5'-cyclic AMP phosphodiesterase CpdA
VKKKSALELGADAGATPWSGLDQWPQRPRDFSFVLLSDRTGFARQGVFERAVRATKLLHPDFVIQIGDCIEGYTSDVEELSRQWSEFEAIASGLELPLFRVPGNHDVSNQVMQQEWLRRYGALYYHFRYQDVLFLVLDTQDPPQTASDFKKLGDIAGDGGEAGAVKLDALRRLWETDPFEFAKSMERAVDSEGAQPARLSEAQLDWAETTLRAHADARWTVLLMHMPIWQGEHPGFQRIRAALTGRRYSAFAGHLHNYQRRLIDRREHIRLGPTGGAWVTTAAEGNFDHITVVTITGDGVKVVNLVVDGILGPEGGAFRPAPIFP